VLSACVAAVKCRPILHRCVVILSGPQASWIVYRVHALGGVSVVASFITTDAQLQ